MEGEGLNVRDIFDSVITLSITTIIFVLPKKEKGERSVMKKAAFISALLITLLSTCSIANFVSKSEAKQIPDIEISSASVGFYAIRRGNLVDLYVNIQNINNLYGFDINVTWNPFELQYVSHSVRIPVEVFPDGILHQVPGYPVIIVKNHVNVPLGRYWIAAASTGAPWCTPPEGAPPFNGCGNVVIITFSLLVAQPYVIGFCGITLADAPDGPFDPSDPIPYIIQEGIEITVPTMVEFNPPIFNFVGGLRLRLANMQLTIRSIGYAGFVLIQTTPTTPPVALFVGQPGSSNEQYALLPFETLLVPLILGFSPAVKEGTFEVQVSISWAGKTVRETLEIKTTGWATCSNFKVIIPGATVRFVWILHGGSLAYLEVEESLPSGWSYVVDPLIGTIFETPYTISLNITAAESATEGDRGVIVLKAFHAGTSMLFWQFAFAAAVDTTPPSIEVIRPRYLNYTQVLDRIVRIEANISDITSGIDTVEIFYSINMGSWTKKTMEWVNGDTFNSTKYSITIPLQTKEIIKYYIITKDNTGYIAVTKNYTYIPGDTDWLEPYDVDILDVVIITACYGSKIGQPNWDERADVDGDGKVDISDVVIACVNYGKKDP